MSAGLVAALTVAIVAAWERFLATCLAAGPGERLAYAGLLAAGQIVLAQLLPGIFGWLTAGTVLALNLSISAIVAGFALRRKRVVPQVMPGGGKLLSPALLALLILLVATSLWLVAAAALLPPRGVDDLAYHLPPLYQAVQTGRISILPLELRESFAMPFNADLLFLWPLLLMHSDRWIDIVQFVVAIYGAVVIYVIASRLGATRRDAAFAGLLLVFTPVVLGQSGSNYVDVIVAVLHLVMLYAMIAYRQTADSAHLVLAGIATGLALGAKYTMIPLVLAAQPLLYVPLVRAGSVAAALRRYALYWLAALPFFAYWYARNWIETGSPFFPFRLTATGLSGIEGTVMATALSSTGPSALTTFVAEPFKLLLYPFQDFGLGSFHGGFGAIFWGICLPLLTWQLLRALRPARHGDYFALIFWGQFAIALAVYLATVRYRGLQYDQRYVLAVAGFGLLSLAVFLSYLRAAWPAAVAWLQVACVSIAALAVVQLGSYVWPGFRLSGPVADRRAGTYTSDYRYYRQGADSPGSLAVQSVAWDPLDYLTRGARSWRVYVAADWNSFPTPPLFGSRLQNTVWNFERDPRGEPDAFIFARLTPGGPLFYLGPRITPEQVAAGDRYDLVAQTMQVSFWVRREIIRDPRVSERLKDYYLRAYGRPPAMLAPLRASCPADAVLLTGAPVGPLLRYLDLAGETSCPVSLVRPGTEGSEAQRRGLERVVTVDVPLAGFDSRTLFTARSEHGSMAFIDNRRAR
jgi:hypothetical protein